ncbi:MAG: hypothetical protein ABI828_00070 [Actinomycetota bacterium]
MRERSAERFEIGAAAGVAGPCVFLLVAFSMAFLRRDVIQVEGWVSWPSSMAIGGLAGTPQILAFLTLASCYPLFAWWALRPALGTGVVAFTVIAAGELCLAFPTDARGHGHSWHGTVHLIGVLVVTAATALASAQISAATWKRSSWRAWRLVGVPSIAAGVVVGAVAGFGSAWAKVFFVLAITLPIPLLARLVSRDGATAAIG